MRSTTASSDPAGIVLRPLETSDDFQAAVALQRVIWGPHHAECVPATVLQIAPKVGGVAAGAFAPDERLNGFVFGITGWSRGHLCHWSHMLAVRPEFRDRGIGRALKGFQRTRVRNLGVQRMYWTFDPLVARNAHLNLERLGARVIAYVPDFYGTDEHNLQERGIGSDRFVVEWRFGKREMAGRNSRRPGVEAAPVIAPRPRRRGGLPDAPVVWVEIPGDIHALKRSAPDAAVAWRGTTRSAFTHYLALGYRVQRFARDDAGNRRYYVLVRRIDGDPAEEPVDPLSGG